MLNPLSLLEKAINEHGSAVILKERLAQAKEQFALLEKQLTQKDVEISERNTTISDLQRDCENLRLEAEQEHCEIERLSKQIQDAYDHDHCRDPKQVSILKILDPHVGKQLSEIANECELSEKITVLQLQLLRNDRMVFTDNFPDDPIWSYGIVTPLESTWTITHLGLKYLDANGLLA